MADNYTQATLTPDVRLTDELRTVLEITGASLEPAGDGEWYVYWEDGISELDDDQAWDIPQYTDAAGAAAFRDRWSGKDIAGVLRAVLASNPGTGMLVIEGAYGCSKMRAGEFGGFGIYVTREQSAFISSQDVVMQDGRLAVTAGVQDLHLEPDGTRRAGEPQPRRPDEPARPGEDITTKEASALPLGQTTTVTGTHGETLTVTGDFEPWGMLDGELLVKVSGPRGACKYQFTISRQELARLWPGSATGTGTTAGHVNSAASQGGALGAAPPDGEGRV